MLRGFPVTIALPGTISADATFFFEAPCDLTLRAVSAAANNTATTTYVNVGTKADPDGYLDNKAIGQDDEPTLFDLDDFNGDLVSDQGNDYPHISKGTIVAVGLDVGDGTDPADPCIVLWLQEG
jgi:hypothetical protein